MADLFADVERCPACGNELSRYGCRAPADVGAFCHAPPPSRTSRRARTPRPPVVFEIPPTAAVQACQKCGAPIVFVRHTRTGNWMVLEADGAHRGQSHFARCPEAHSFRRPK